MPLRAQHETLAGDGDGFDDAVIRNRFHLQSVAQLVDALLVQRVDLEFAVQADLFKDTAFLRDDGMRLRFIGVFQRLVGGLAVVVLAGQFVDELGAACRP